jgi:hypothetical protein
MGGPHTRANVRITHLSCNLETNNLGTPSPKYMRAHLSELLDGTPVPEELHRSLFPSWRWPAKPLVEQMIALSITAGWVAADPRYGDPATRLQNAARQFAGDRAEDAIRDGLDWIDKVNRRRAPIDARWRTPK